jgi:hypothetical protein
LIEGAVTMKVCVHFEHCTFIFRRFIRFSSSLKRELQLSQVMIIHCPPASE